MKRALMAGLGCVVALVAAAPAHAGNVDVFAVDAGEKWDKSTVNINPGDTVTWRFDNTALPHNVEAEGTSPDPAWTPTAFKTTPLVASPPSPPFQFNTPGTYTFVCEVHRTTMRGTVVVGNPAPVVVPLSEQSFANDAATPVALEKVELDKAKPKLSKVSAKRVARGSVRVRFRVNEESTVLVSLKRGGKTVKKAEYEGTGTRSVTLKGAKAGRYSVQVRATDIAGNRSSLKKTSITVR
ncbi:plastocyanin [Solirubrobacter pauli]|uniref:Plastocyanin n=1 Tax=Solirubrobacter pauli TaxID=166793 RepID=A0A660L114_9ACTN|nr:plastocyanin/azurin family copper-binding protein [Solirubrobacter pauli]RKQ87556.1 plastocyanin [Solirubrobacter pauli]